MKIRIGVLSDTHLRRVTDEFRNLFDRHLSDADMILHAGDFVSEELVDFLSERKFHGVCGNMDPPEVRDLLPERQVLEVGTFRLGLVHGWGPSAGLEDRILRRMPDVDILVYGHSHEPVIHEKGGVLFFNPGTAMGYSSSGTHTVGRIEIDDSVRGEIVEVG